MGYNIKQSATKAWYFNLQSNNKRLTRHRYNSGAGAKKGIRAEISAVLYTLGIEVTPEIANKIDKVARDAYEKRTFRSKNSSANDEQSEPSDS